MHFTDEELDNLIAVMEHMSYHFGAPEDEALLQRFKRERDRRAAHKPPAPPSPAG